MIITFESLVGMLFGVALMALVTVLIYLTLTIPTIKRQLETHLLDCDEHRKLEMKLRQEALSELKMLNKICDSMQEQLSTLTAQALRGRQ